MRTCLRWRGLVGVGAALLAACAPPTAPRAAAPPTAPTAAAAPAAPVASEILPSGTAPQRLTKVVQALPVDSFGFLPLYVGREKGFFREEGLDLETPIMGSSAAVAGLVNGNVDFAVAGTGVRAAMQGAPVKAVLYYYNSVLFEFVVVPEIRGLTDLRSKNLGTSSRGSTEEVTASVMLRRAGVDPAEVTFVVVPAGSQLPSLLAEAIHGMMVNPDLSALAVQQGLRVLKTVEEVGQAMPSPFSGFVAAQETLDQRPDRVKAWLRANVRAIRFVRERPAEAAEVAAAVLGMDRQVAADAVPRVTQAINPDDFGGFTEEGFQREIETNLRALGGQAQVTKIEDLADLTLLRQVQRELGVPCKSGYQCH